MSVLVQSRMDKELKRDAEMVMKAVGLKPAEAIRVFYQQVINAGGLPFSLKVPQPNAETEAAMKDTQNRENLSSYENFDDLRKELDV